MATRRTVLKAVLASGAVRVFEGSLGGLLAFAQTSLPVRRSLHGMPLNDPDLDAYRSFVRLMLAKDQSKPASWLGFSLQHGTYGGDYKFCPHGDWYFLPWHRAFVVMYEAAVRSLTGHPQFAMPYWDWTVDRTMPAAFTDKTYDGKPNPLYVAGRTLTNKRHWPLPDSIVGPLVMAQIYRETDFQLFGTSRNPEQDNLDMSWVVEGGGAQGVLERTPHNTVHNWIGKYMPSAGSPRDPIFMMHHSNIDRIWASWNALGRSNTSGMDAATQTLWLDMNFLNNYLHPDGTPYSMMVKDVQSPAPLGYTYGGLPTADNARVDAARSQRRLALFGIGGAANALPTPRILPSTNRAAATLARPLVKEAQLPKSTMASMLAEAPEGMPSPEVVALIKNMVVSANVESVRVFVNAGQVSAATPDSDPHFVTQISFLQHGGGGGHQRHAPPSVLVDLTEALKRLKQQGLLKGDAISVHLVPVLRDGAVGAATAQVVPAAIEIAVL